MSDSNDYLIKGEMYQYNLGWLIKELLSFKQDLATAIDLKTIKYADPIQWDITTQYAANTVVIDPKTGTAYMSKVPVPAGVELTNTNYWVVIFNYQDIYYKIMDGVTFNDRDSDTATKDLFVNDLVWYAGDLYRVTRAISEGSKYIPGTNLVKTTIENLLVNYYGRDRTATVNNDTVTATGDYTVNAGDIATTSDNLTQKVTKDREIDVDGSDSVHIDGVSTVNVGGLRTEVYAGDKTEKVTGTTTEEFVGTHTENHGGKKIVNAEDIVLNPTEPLTYGTPEKLNQYFNKIKMKDPSGNAYNLLADRDSGALSAAGVYNVHLRFRTAKERYSAYWTDSPYSAIQGGCLVGDNIVVISPNTNTAAKSNTSLIEEYNNAGTLLRSAEIDVGHGNDLCYKDGKLYCVPNEMWSGDNYGVVNRLIIIDYASLTIDKTLTTPNTPYGCCFIGDDLVSMLRYESPAQFVKIDLNTGAMTPYFTSEYQPWSPDTIQTLCNIDGDIGILTYGKNTITVISTQDGSIIKRVGLPDYIKGYDIGEPEFCDWNGKYFVLGSARSVYSYAFNLFFEYGNTTSDSPLYYIPGRGDVYVNNQKTVPLPDGTEAAPFYCMAEVTQIYRHYDIRVTAFVTAGKPYLYTELSGFMGVIRGGEHYGILQLGGAVALFDATLTPNNPNTISYECNNGITFMGYMNLNGIPKFQFYYCVAQFGNASNLPANVISARDCIICFNSPIAAAVFSSDYDNVAILTNQYSSGYSRNLPFDNKVITIQPYAVYFDNGKFDFGTAGLDNIKAISRRCIVRYQQTECAGRYVDSTGHVYYTFTRIEENIPYTYYMDANLTANTITGTKFNMVTHETTSVNAGYTEFYFHPSFN